METSNYFQDCDNAIDLMKRYMKLCLLNHPLTGGSSETMKKIFQDYQLSLKSDAIQFTNLSEELQKDLTSLPGLMKEIISLKLKLEMIGCWLWVSGRTYDHREKLKELGLRYSADKKFWYWKPSTERSANANPMPIILIREKYGSEVTYSPKVETLQKEEAGV